MKKSILIFFIISLLTACSSMGIRKSKLKFIDSTFKGFISNNHHKIKGRKYGSPDLLNTFEIRNAQSDTIWIEFSKSENLIIKYYEHNILKEAQFNGKFTKKGFYDLYLRNERKEFPPIFPIIYSKKNILNIRIGLTKENDLIIDHFWIEGGNIFILGAGSSGRRQSFYNIFN
ncbi:MAG: hypothetical protein KDD24_10210, partial [Flavobacteriales bacterium]|nr:hypothetical protein [Flavobacteriales bacterium]